MSCCVPNPQIHLWKPSSSSSAAAAAGFIACYEYLLCLFPLYHLLEIKKIVASLIAIFFKNLYRTLVYAMPFFQKWILIDYMNLKTF